MAPAPKSATEILAGVLISMSSCMFTTLILFSISDGCPRWFACSVDFKFKALRGMVYPSNSLNYPRILHGEQVAKQPKTGNKHINWHDLL